MTRGEKIEHRALARVGQLERTDPRIFPDLLRDRAAIGDLRFRQRTLGRVIDIDLTLTSPSLDDWVVEIREDDQRIVTLLATKDIDPGAH